MIYDEKSRTITTDRLVLRLFDPSDAETVAHLCHNHAIYKTTLHIPHPYSVDCALSWMENHLDNFNADRSYEFALTNKETGALYGAIGLSHDQRHRNGEMGYWVGEEFWGNGYATEAGKAVLNFAFDIKQYHRVYARHFVSNPSSGTVMKNLGMVWEGIMVDHVIKEGRYESVAFYGIINPVHLGKGHPDSS